jgi:predicted AAA+ superfamily ATPase
VLVIYGPRRVGKTTLLSEFLKQTTLLYKFESGENMEVQQVLSSSDFKKNKRILHRVRITGD